MTLSVLLWLIAGGLAALLFFCTASVIAVIGFHDLRDLLTHSAKKEADV
jgi:hypothetical protein